MEKLVIHNCTDENLAGRGNVIFPINIVYKLVHKNLTNEET